MVNYDLATAQQMLKTGRYVYVVFMCHMAIEKALKAVISQRINKLPPKTHDLIYLLDAGKIELLAELIDFIGIINNASIVTRYPEDLSQLVSSYPKNVAKRYFDKTLEVIKCIKREMK